MQIYIKNKMDFRINFIDGSTQLYTKSKILAEKKAWEMVNNPPDGKKLELVTILPGFVVGKPLYKASGSSIDTVSGILTEILYYYRITLSLSPHFV